MDLTLQVGENSKLNIRVAVIMETENGFVFSQNQTQKYFYTLGGRAKINENSVESAAREVAEEVGLKIPLSDFKLISIVENFWSVEKDSVNWKVHEINFVFSVPKQEKLGVGTDTDSMSLHEIKKEEIQNLDIRPAIIKKIILEQNPQTFTHYIV